jgi:hypothetical protein
MAAASIGSRVAGELLGEYLKGAGQLGISAAQKVGAKGADVASYLVPGMSKGSLPSRILEKGLTAGTVLGEAAAVNQAIEFALPSASGGSQRSAYSLPIQQQYEAAAALEQQKFMNQMAVIQARQAASMGQSQMHYGMTPNMVDPMSIANQMFKVQEY